MQKLTFALLLLTITLFLGSCWMNPNMQKPGVKEFQGEWQQDSVPMQKKLLTYSLYHFKFTCDSFFVSIKTFTKVNYGADSCMKAGHWTEYTKGNYGQRNDSLFLKGEFCKPDFTLKETAGCFRFGMYEEVFKVTKKTDSVYQFSSTSAVIPITARLIKRTTCIVKPL